jgi:hypothetical protein
MGSGTYGLAPLNLLVVVLVFGLVLLLLWPELRRKRVVQLAAARGPRPLKPKTGADCPLCQAEPEAIIDEGRATVLPRPWREGGIAPIRGGQFYRTEMERLFWAWAPSAIGGTLTAFLFRRLRRCRHEEWHRRFGRAEFAVGCPGLWAAVVISVV